MGVPGLRLGAWVEEGLPHHLALENGVLLCWTHQGGTVEPELRFIRNVGRTAGMLEPELPFAAAVARGTWRREAGDPSLLPPSPARASHGQEPEERSSHLQPEPHSLAQRRTEEYAWVQRPYGDSQRLCPVSPDPEKVAAAPFYIGKNHPTPFTGQMLSPPACDGSGPTPS